MYKNMGEIPEDFCDWQKVVTNFSSFRGKELGIPRVSFVEIEVGGNTLGFQVGYYLLFFLSKPLFC